MYCLSLGNSNCSPGEGGEMEVYASTEQAKETND
jgi:hypothetical protein